MFCYFIQKKGFLDQNLHYLQHKLATCQAPGRTRQLLWFLPELPAATIPQRIRKTGEPTNRPAPRRLRKNSLPQRGLVRRARVGTAV